MEKDGEPFFLSQDVLIIALDAIIQSHGMQTMENCMWKMIFIIK
jgi:hypothetical protein